MIFALVSPALFALVGGAVDYASLTRDENRLQAAADATALAIAREMTLSIITADRAQSLAASYAQAHAGTGTTATGSLIEKNTAIKVALHRNFESPSGILSLLGGIHDLEVTAVARVVANPNPAKLCVLSLGERTNGGILMHNNAVLNAPECMLQSNSHRREAVVIEQGSRLVSQLTCARGGIRNNAGMLQTTLLTDCPPVLNPLEGKPEPPLDGPCIASRLVIKGEDRRQLMPGTYCQGVTVEGSAQVTLSPGIYVFRDGPLIVSQNSEFSGTGITLMFAGTNAYFRFLDNSLIRLSAATSGATAGMLIWESKTRNKAPLTDGASDCSSEEEEDFSPNCAKMVAFGTERRKKRNEHHINSDRARELTGTIYLRNGLLLVDSRQPVADQSPFTVLVVNKLDLFDGPMLTLNANYGASSVPVPPGLGPLGAKNVRLGM